MRISTDFIPSVVLLILVGWEQHTHAAQLDCFSCNEIDNLDDCHTTATCLPSEHCYTETYLNKTGHLAFTLGCREMEFCRGLDQAFGKKRQTVLARPGCLQCCTLHGCNKYLCPLRYQTPAQPVNGAWSGWGPWSNCDSTCGIGLKARYRACNNPPPSQNGQLCLGDAKDVKLCQTDCPPVTVPVTSTTAKPVTSTPPPTVTTTTSLPSPPTASTTLKPATLAPTATTTTTTTAKPVSVTVTHPPYVTHDLTQSPGGCKDLIDCSGYYRPDACFGVYSAWAHRYCPAHCGFCPTAIVQPCADTVVNCHEYQDDLCTNTIFWQWRESHCRKYCKLC